jgi:hypothetical protein
VGIDVLSWLTDHTPEGVGDWLREQIAIAAVSL